MAQNDTESILELLNVALGSGLPLTERDAAAAENLLQRTAAIMEAEGCVLWQMKPDSATDEDPSGGQLFVLASWFREGGIFAVHDLAVNNSVTGEGVRSQRPQYESDVRDSGGATRVIQFFNDKGIGPMCSAPIQFADGSLGALSVYRSKKQPRFKDADAQQLSILARAVPLLYQASREQVSLELLNRIDRDLQNARVVDEGRPVERGEIQSVLKSICSSVQQMVHSLEVTIYLEDPAEDTGSYRMCATTWDEAASEPSYPADEAHGLTGWVLANRRPVHLFDLRDFLKPDARRQIENKYPRLRWRNLNAFPMMVARKLGLNEKEMLPPLSYMAAPICYQDQLLGVIRCCTSYRGAYYYSTRELKLLELVAGRIGQFWESWTSSCALQNETNQWQNFVREASALNDQCRLQLSQYTPDEDVILKQALELCGRVIPGATINGIRRVNEESNELYYAVFDDESYRQIDGKKRKELKAARFPLGEPYQSAGAYVVATGKPRWIPDIEQDEYFRTSHGSSLGATVRCVVVAPINVGKKVFGTLELQGTAAEKFPRHVEEFAQLIGSQLGLYLHSVAMIRELNATKEQTSRRFQDLAHQLRGPIIQIQKRAHLPRLDEPEFAKRALFAVRGLSRKAWQTTLSMKLLGELHSGGTIQPHKRRLDEDLLIKRLIELCQDFQLLCPPDRQIKFDVDKKTFTSLRDRTVMVDYDLLDHALNNVVDNAFKYSMPRGVLNLSGGWMPHGNHFCLSVTNTGIQMDAEDVQRCTGYGWRGKYAQVVTGEGSGIGLWLVDNIMRAHGGDLLIAPTDNEGNTIVRLLFPAVAEPK